MVGAFQSIVRSAGQAADAQRSDLSAECGDDVSFAVVMPMAGRGQRFKDSGITTVPKPLVELEGRPLFWWAAESVRRHARVSELVFVVLEDHIGTHSIDRRIQTYFPEARIVSIPEVTAGAAESAAVGVDTLRARGPLVINDCDHVFQCSRFDEVASLLSKADGALLTFSSCNPAFSYLVLSRDGDIIGTAEKQVTSDYAIGGCYLFAESGLFTRTMQEYREACRYDELFVSGLFDCLLSSGRRIAQISANHYCPLGTPADIDRAKQGGLAPFIDWVRHADGR